MRKSTSILLDDDSEAFIGQQIAEGHFASPSEVVEAGLRLLRDHDQELEAIRAALIEGEESGIARDFDPDAFLKRMHDKLAERRGGAAY
jgi:antitoxin ParD1/3/4